MSSAPDRQQPTPPPPQLPPQDIGRGHPEYHFVQSILELQRTLGEIQASIRHLTGVAESTKAKVDDLVKWKHMIIGGVATAGFLLGLMFAAIRWLNH